MRSDFDQPERKRRIVVADDDDLIARAMAQSMAALGYDVAVAHTAAEAVVLCAERRPSAVFLGYIMPGYDSVKRAIEIQTRWPGTAVILSTEAVPSGVLESCRLQGHVFRTLEAPFQYSALMSLLEQIFEEARLAGAAQANSLGVDPRPAPRLRSQSAQRESSPFERPLDNCDPPSATLLPMAKRRRNEVRRAGYPWLIIAGRRWRLTDLAKSAKLPVSTVYRVFMADSRYSSRNPRLETMVKIAQGTGANLDDVLAAIRGARALKHVKLTGAGSGDGTA